MLSGQTQTRSFYPLAIALAALLGSCTTYEREFVCTASTQCLRDGVAGSCVEPGHCAFEDSQCGSGLRWDQSARDSFASDCVTSENVEELNACGGLGILPLAPGVACGLCNTGMSACDGKEAVICENELDLEMSITQQGSVSASAEFGNDYVAIKAADLDESTSWFSTGPEATPTEFLWVGTRDDCLTHIKVVGNGGHSNSSFRTDFGFGEATVQVLTEADEVVYSKSVDLTGTPDPNIDLDPNVMGRKIKLLLSGHESDDCGGFGEIYITATR